MIAIDKERLRKALRRHAIRQVRKNPIVRAEIAEVLESLNTAYSRPNVELPLIPFWGQTSKDYGFPEYTDTDFQRLRALMHFFNGRGSARINGFKKTLNGALQYSNIKVVPPRCLSSDLDHHFLKVLVLRYNNPNDDSTRRVVRGIPIEDYFGRNWSREEFNRTCFNRIFAAVRRAAFQMITEAHMPESLWYADVVNKSCALEMRTTHEPTVVAVG